MYIYIICMKLSANVHKRLFHTFQIMISILQHGEKRVRNII